MTGFYNSICDREVFFMSVPPARSTTETEIVKHQIASGELDLILTRHARAGSEDAEPTLLLVHGASAASCTFGVPRAQCLIDDLLNRGADVWTLDWRGSNRVSPNYLGNPMRFTLDRAAEWDITAAIENIRKRKPKADKVAVFGHCMGAGVLAMAIGGGFVQAEHVSHVVLSTLGLFYQVPWDGWVRAEDYTLERIRGADRDAASIDTSFVRKAWPKLMERIYERWPATFMPPGDNEIFRRVAFMFGTPFQADLVPDDVSSERELRRQFGEIPIILYMHCAQNVRRGYAARFDSTGHNEHPEATYLNLGNFHDIELTLMTGGRNELWHPDSIHRMYDWLQRSRHKVRSRKVIFPKYAHQDLLWGRDAPSEVYPTIATGLGL